MDRKLLAVDGNSLMHRAFWALPPMNDAQGRPTNALFGFLNMFFSLVGQYSPDYLVVAFDKKGKTFRHEFYPEYKAGRRATPPELSQQLVSVREILSALGVRYIEMDSYEADDIIGTIACHSGCTNYLVTGDKDYLQLVSGNTSVILTRKGISETECFTPEHLDEVYGIKPEQIVDLKALMGDSSDNIPGIPGIGEKTALKILHDYSTIENLFANIDSLPKNKLREKIENGRESAVLSYRLATINRNIPGDVTLDELAFGGFDTDRLKKVFAEYNFSSMMKKFNLEGDAVRIEPEVSSLREISDLILKSDEISVFFDNDFHFSFDSGKDYIVRVRYSLLDEGYDYSEIIDFIRGIKGIDIIAFDVKKLMHDTGIQPRGFFDLSIASWVVNPSGFPSSFADMCSSFNLPQSSAVMFILKEKYLAAIKESGLEQIYYDIELPLLRVLYSMEKEGMYVDTGKLEELKNKYSLKISESARLIYDYAGHEFNISSPKQLGTVLFEELGLPVIKKNKKGFSTDAEVLDKLEDMHPVISEIKNYRQLTKLLSTYVEGLLEAGKSGKIHTTFLQTATQTGRLSSVEPNLQNIPVRSELANDIRDAFYAPEGYSILSADYSQIELRILAHIADDANLKDAFSKGQDIHARTASEILHKPIEEVTPKERSEAKAVNFGIVYGISDFGLARNVGIPVKKAAAYIENYLSEFGGIASYMDEIRDAARRDGYVRTMYGRIRYIPEISSANFNVRSFGERAALNTPVQGTAADIIKIAMIQVYNRLEQGKYRSKMVLQVHDELLIYVHNDEMDEIKEMVEKTMTEAVSLSVPMKVNISSGKFWSEAK